jgi:MYXO-CTERM domain-containing protein
MSGSSLSFAQDAVPVVAAPAQTAPPEAPVAAPVVAPPPAVSTLPSPNDTINPQAARDAAAETPRQPAAATTAKTVVKPRATAPVNATVTANASPSPSIEPEADIAAPAVETIEPADTAIQGAKAIAPVTDAEAQNEGLSSEDMTLFGGLAAALAAIGLGAAFASRRRRRIVADDRISVAHTDPEYTAPRPIKDDPVFQQFAPAPAFAERPVKRAPMVTRPDMPITDPLFSAPVMAGPITDPLFAPRNDVEPPITDPLFAKHDRFAGRASTAPTQNRERELVS